MNSNQKFMNFLENMKGTGNDALVESISSAYNIIFENGETNISNDPDLEHTIGDYYYDNKAGRYYDRSSDVYVDDDTVNRVLNARSDGVRLNNKVLGMMLKEGILNGKEYRKLMGRVDWDENIMRGVWKRAEDKGINISDMFTEAKAKDS